VRERDADWGARYNEAFYVAALLGGATGWVQGMIRKVGPSLLGLAAPRARLLAPAFALSQLGAVAATVGAALPGTVAGVTAFDAGLVASALGMALFLAGARAFERGAGLEIELAGGTKRVPRPGVAAPAVRRAARGAFAGAALFALLGGAHGVMDLAGHTPPPALWDGARHALALGFLMPLILALASHLVPIFAGLSGPANAPLPRAAWRDAGLVLIAIGLVGRELQVPAFLLVMPRLLWLSGTSGIVAAVGVGLAAAALLGPLGARSPAARPAGTAVAKAA